MKKKNKWIGAFTIFVVLAFSMASCDTGSGGGGSGNNNNNNNNSGTSFNGTPKWDINGLAYSIVFYTKANLNVGNGSSESYKVGFNVIANDENQIISSVTVYNDRVEIIFGSGKTFTGSTVIKFSYDGTGGLSGKLSTFSNITVTYDANMYANIYLY